MRHIRSILYAFVLAPAAWVLTGVGLNSDLTTRGRDSFAVENFLGLLLLLLAGAAYGILVLGPISPAGPLAAGAIYLAITVWALLAPSAYADAWPPSVAKEGFDLSRPGFGLAALLAVPLMCTALSTRRWQKYEPPVLPLIGDLGRFWGRAAAPGTPIAAAPTTVLPTTAIDPEPTTVLRLPASDNTTVVVAGPPPAPSVPALDTSAADGEATTLLTPPGSTAHAPEADGEVEADGEATTLLGNRNAKSADKSDEPTADGGPVTVDEPDAGEPTTVLKPGESPAAEIADPDPTTVLKPGENSAGEAADAEPTAVLRSGQGSSAEVVEAEPTTLLTPVGGPGAEASAADGEATTALGEDDAEVAEERTEPIFSEKLPGGESAESDGSEPTVAMTEVGGDETVSGPDEEPSAAEGDEPTDAVATSASRDELPQNVALAGAEGDDEFADERADLDEPTETLAPDSSTRDEQPPVAAEESTTDFAESGPEEEATAPVFEASDDTASAAAPDGDAEEPTVAVEPGADQQAATAEADDAEPIAAVEVGDEEPTAVVEPEQDDLTATVDADDAEPIAAVESDGDEPSAALEADAAEPTVTGEPSGTEPATPAESDRDEQTVAAEADAAEPTAKAGSSADEPTSAAGPNTDEATVAAEADDGGVAAAVEPDGEEPADENDGEPAVAVAEHEPAGATTADEDEPAAAAEAGADEPNADDNGAPDLTSADDSERTQVVRLPVGDDGERTQVVRLPVGDDGERTQVVRLPVGDDGERTQVVRLPLGDDGERTQVVRIPLGESAEDTQAVPRKLLPFPVSDPGERTRVINPAPDTAERTQVLRFPARPIGEWPTRDVRGIGSRTRDLSDRMTGDVGGDETQVIRLVGKTVDDERTQVIRPYLVAPPADTDDEVSAPAEDRPGKAAPVLSIADVEAPDFSEDPTGRIVPFAALREDAGADRPRTVLDMERPADEESGPIPAQRKPGEGE